MIIDGKIIAEKIKKELIEKIKTLKSQPELAVILVGKNPASEIYVSYKQKACLEVGIKSHVYHFDKNVSMEALVSKLSELNSNLNIHGILVQLPLSKHLDSINVLNSINSFKDVDGLHGMNIGWLMHNRPYTIPCTPQGCMILLKSVINNFSGLNAVVIGRSVLVGKPMSTLLTKENATVTLAHSKTKNLKEICRNADILISACGVPKIITEEHVKKGAVVIDVGISKVDGLTVGDVDFEKVHEKVHAITPVPGGVGPMTVACLLKNTVHCYEVLNGVKSPYDHHYE